MLCVIQDAKKPGRPGKSSQTAGLYLYHADSVAVRGSIPLTAGHPVLAQIPGFLHAAADTGKEFPTLRTIRILHAFLAVFVCRKRNAAFLAGQQICNFHKIAPLYVVMLPAAF